MSNRPAACSPATSRPSSAYRSRDVTETVDQRECEAQVQAPAAGRLAAAMATIWARRRPIRDRVERSNAIKRSITSIPGASTQTVGPAIKSARRRYGFPVSAESRSAAKIATRPSPEPTRQQIYCLARRQSKKQNLLRALRELADPPTPYPGANPNVRSKRLT